MSETPTAPRSWDEAPVRDLVEHILETHHRPMGKELPRILALCRKVTRVHGRQEPCLDVLESLVTDLVEELVPHMEKEEQILFPWILKSAGKSAGGPVGIMEEEHEQMGEILRRIRAVAGDFRQPPGTCPSCRALWKGLEDLETNLREHMRLEDEVLFPRVLRGS